MQHKCIQFSFPLGKFDIYEDEVLRAFVQAIQAHLETRMNFGIPCCGLHPPCVAKLQHALCHGYHRFCYGTVTSLGFHWHFKLLRSDLELLIFFYLKGGRKHSSVNTPIVFEINVVSEM